MSSSMVRRPKSMATVVVVLPVTADRSSMPTDRSVMTASVVSGVISDTAPTNVVFPTPNPPATTILTGMGSPTSAHLGLQAGQQALEDLGARAPGVGQRRQVDDEQPLGVQVGHEDPGDADRHAHLGGHLGDRDRAPAHGDDAGLLEAQAGQRGDA